MDQIALTPQHETQFPLGNPLIVDAVKSPGTAEITCFHAQQICSQRQPCSGQLAQLSVAEVYLSGLHHAP